MWNNILTIVRECKSKWRACLVGLNTNYSRCINQGVLFERVESEEMCCIFGFEPCKCFIKSQTVTETDTLRISIWMHIRIVKLLLSIISHILFNLITDSLSIASSRNGTTCQMVSYINHNKPICNDYSQK